MPWECDILCPKKMFQGTSPRKTDVSRKLTGNHPYLALVLGWHALALLYLLDGIFKNGCIRSTVIPRLGLQLSFNTSPAARVIFFYPHSHYIRRVLFHNHWLLSKRLLSCSQWRLRFSKKLTRNTYLANPRKTRFCTHCKSCRLQLETGWVTSSK